MSVGAGSRTYEDLAGETGRRIYYRAERYKARDLFRQNVPLVEVDRVPHMLHDLSMTGIAIFADRETAWTREVGSRVPVRMRINDEVLYEGEDRICRIEPTPFGTKVALHLTSGYLHIPRILARYNEAVLRGALEADVAAAFAAVDPAYRELCGDIVCTFRHFRDALAHLENRTNDVAATADGHDAELFALCEQYMLREWRAFWRRGNELVRPIMGDPEKLRATKRYTELVVTPEFIPGPVVRRCYEKPLGYPGDYQVMNYVYAWRSEGETLYHKLLHRVGLDVMECIANRMVMVQRTITEVIAAKAGGSEPVRITSLGCGPAQEVSNTLELKALPGQVEFTLIDQDKEALAYAYGRTYPKAVHHGDRAVVSCLQTSFRELMRTGQLFHSAPPQDMIYTVGLVDYLGPRRAKALAASLYAQLAPGGLLVIGNMKDAPMGLLWPTEFICDWSLVYRTEADMRALARGLEGAAVDVRTDSLGRVFLLDIRKPRA